jgi:hypothetical protein
MKGQWMVQAVKPERIAELAGSRQYNNRASHTTIMDRFRDVRYFWIGRSGPIRRQICEWCFIRIVVPGEWLLLNDDDDSLILTVKSVTDGW